jgi:TonB family protein
MKRNLILLIALLMLASFTRADTPSVIIGQLTGDAVSPVFAPKPDYTWSAQTNHVQGLGIFQAHIRPDGTVSFVDMIRSTGWRDLDKSSTAAFSKWRFRAVGHPATVKIPVTFTMGIPSGPSHGGGIQGIPHSTPPKT